MINAVGNVQLMQRINRIKVLNYIRKNSPVSRNELASNTYLSLSSITNIINFLIESKLVFEVGRLDMEGAGRRATLLEFNAKAKNIISVNIEPDEAMVALTDLCGNIILSDRVSIVSGMDVAAVLAAVKDEISRIMQKSNFVVAIGVSVSGHVANDSGVVNSSIMHWKAVDVKSFLTEAFSLPVYVANNSKTKAFWEFNAKREDSKKSVVFLDLYKGVGIISFFEGKLNESVTGELGHTTVMKDGPQCFCGNRGCLELVCSEDYVISNYNRKSGKSVDSLIGVIEAMENNDEIATQVLRECAEYFGIGIANIISLFEPEKILINVNPLISCPFIYDTALEEAKRRGHNLMFKEVEFKCVSVTDAQAVQGMSRYVAEQVMAFNGTVL